MEKDIEALNLSASLKLMEWHRKVLNITGIWPLNVYDSIFSFYCVYLTVHCALAFVDLIDNIGNLQHVMNNIAESLCLAMTLAKLILCRVHRRSIASVLKNIENDFRAKSYRNAEEAQIFLAYNRLSYVFSIASVVTMGVATTLYYIKALLINVNIATKHTSLPYRLPYKVREFVEIRDFTTYVCLCAYQALVVPIITFGNVGYDCFFVSLTLHVASQFAVLTCRVEKATEDAASFRCGLKSLILRHYHLIRYALRATKVAPLRHYIFFAWGFSIVETLESDFNIAVLIQMLGTTFNLCISGYNTLLYSTGEQKLRLIIFVMYVLSVLSTLLVYCYIGECLIQESAGLNDALYQCKWYETSPLNSKLIHICMMRARKPLQLTSGKFFILSLSTFTDILKASMGYLSVLRTFM